MLNTTQNIILLLNPCIGGQKRSRSSLPSIISRIITGLRFDSIVLVDCIYNQLDASQEEAYSIWDLQKYNFATELNKAHHAAKLSIKYMLTPRKTSRSSRA
jgi:hypothetical protein